MPIHSASSRTKLKECHHDLQRLVEAVSDKIGLLVVCGHRCKDDQNLAFTTGRSKLTWPHSKHNKLPSLAVDLAPLNDEGKLDWNDIAAFDRLGEIMLMEAELLGIQIKWGGNWLTFKDRPHFELVDHSAGSVV